MIYMHICIFCVFEIFHYIYYNFYYLVPLHIIVDNKVALKVNISIFC